MNTHFCDVKHNFSGPWIYSGCFNGSAGAERPEFNLYDTFLIITGIITIAVNGLVFYLFSRKHYLKTATNYFLISLAASDFLAGILVLPLYVACVVSFVPMLCINFDIFQRVVAASNIFHLAAVTAERYVTIIYPLRSPRLMTKKRIGLAIGSIWFVSLFISLIQFAWILQCTDVDLTSQLLCSEKYNIVYDTFCVVIIFFLPLLSMYYADVRMLLVVIQQSKMINIQTKRTGKNKATHHYRAVVTFTVMLGTFTLCWSFFFLIPTCKLLGYQFPLMLDHVQFFLRFCSPFINPIIYIFFKHDFKRAFVGLFLQRFGWSGSTSGVLTENHGSTSVMMKRRAP